MSLRIFKERAGVLGLLVLPLPLVAAWQDQEPPAESPAEAPVETPPVHIDERADRLLWRMSEYLKAAEAFQFRVDVTADEPHPSGQWVQVSRRGTAVIHRKRGIRASVDGDLARREFWCDLTTAAMLDPDQGLYALVAVPPELDDVLDFMIDEYGVSWPMADFVYSDPYVVLTEAVRLGVYVGLHDVDGVPSHHLAFRQDSIDWQIWIDAGPYPLPRKFSITYRQVEGAPRYTAKILKWDFSPFAPESVFAFDPPDGAEEIEMESLSGD